MKCCNRLLLFCPSWHLLTAEHVPHSFVLVKHTSVDSCYYWLLLFNFALHLAIILLLPCSPQQHWYSTSTTLHSLRCLELLDSATWLLKFHCCQRTLPSIFSFILDNDRRNVHNDQIYIMKWFTKVVGVIAPVLKFCPMSSKTKGRTTAYGWPLYAFNRNGVAKFTSS